MKDWAGGNSSWGGEPSSSSDWGGGGSWGGKPAEPQKDWGGGSGSSWGPKPTHHEGREWVGANTQWEPKPAQNGGWKTGPNHFEKEWARSEWREAKSEADRQRKIAITDAMRASLSAIWDEAIADIRVGAKNGIRPGLFTPWRNYFEKIVIPRQTTIWAFVGLFLILFAMQDNPKELMFLTDTLWWYGHFAIYIILPAVALKYQFNTGSEDYAFRKQLYEVARYDSSNKEDRLALKYVLEEARLRDNSDLIMYYMIFGFCLSAAGMLYGDILLRSYGNFHIYFSNLLGIPMALVLMAMHYFWRLRVA